MTAQYQQLLSVVASRPGFFKNMHLLWWNPRRPLKNSRMVDAFVSKMDSMINLPWESITAAEIVAW
jgi:hypothetical protein